MNLTIRNITLSDGSELGDLIQDRQMAMRYEKLLKQLRAEMRGVCNTPPSLGRYPFKRMENWIKRISNMVDV